MRMTDKINGFFVSSSACSKGSLKDLTLELKKTREVWFSKLIADLIKVHNFVFY